MANWMSAKFQMEAKTDAAKAKLKEFIAYWSKRDVVPAGSMKDLFEFFVPIGEVPDDDPFFVTDKWGFSGRASVDLAEGGGVEVSESRIKAVMLTAWGCPHLWYEQVQGLGFEVFATWNDGEYCGWFRDGEANYVHHESQLSDVAKIAYELCHGEEDRQRYLEGDFRIDNDDEPVAVGDLLELSVTIRGRDSALAVVVEAKEPVPHYILFEEQIGIPSELIEECDHLFDLNGGPLGEGPWGDRHSEPVWQELKILVTGESVPVTAVLHVDKGDIGWGVD